MFQNVKKAFQIKEIRNRLIFTVIMLFVIRFGSQLPVPGVDRTYFSRWLAQQTSGDAFSLFDAFTGGSFLNMSILALNITPYITASIILQLLTIAIPKLEEMQREGEEGRKLIVSITRYVTVGLGLIQGTAYYFFLKNTYDSTAPSDGRLYTAVSAPSPSVREEGAKRKPASRIFSQSSVPLWVLTSMPRTMMIPPLLRRARSAGRVILCSGETFVSDKKPRKMMLCLLHISVL